MRLISSITMVKKASDALKSDFNPREPPESGETFIKRGSGDLTIKVTEENVEVFLDEYDFEVEVGDRVTFSENDEIPAELPRQKPVIWHHFRDCLEVRNSNNEIISKCQFL